MLKSKGFLAASLALIAGGIAAASDGIGSFSRAAHLTLPGPRKTYHRGAAGTKLACKAAKGRLGLATLR